MTTLADVLPKESQTVSAIYAAYKQRGDAEPKRGYLGASIIGHECERYLWFCFRQANRPDWSGRMYRLFETGDHEEARFVADLRAIGCEVHDRDPDTGQQFEVSDLGGHFSGHMDSCILGLPEAPKTWHVGEFKTHNAKSYAKLVKEGAQKAKPMHYAQMQAYMHLTGMKRALYLAVNKDTDELHSERIRYDKDFASGLMEKARRIVTATDPPERISDRPDWYECRFCDAKAICWGEPGREPYGIGHWVGQLPALPVLSLSCRQCCHATPTMDGNARWVCEKHGRGLSPADQDRPCEDHILLPGLIAFAKPTDYGKDAEGYEWIEFKQNYGNKDTPNWRHGRGLGCYGSRELMTLPADLLASAVADVKHAFGARVNAFCPDDILHRYPESDSRIVWKGRASQLIDTWKAKYDEDMTTLVPLAKCDAVEYRAAEYEGGRVAIYYPFKREAEIREGIE